MSAFKTDLGELTAELPRACRAHPKRMLALLLLLLAATVFVAAVLISWLHALMGMTGVLMAIFFLVTGLLSLVSMAIEAYDAEMIARRYEEEEERAR